MPRATNRNSQVSPPTFLSPGSLDRTKFNPDRVGISRWKKLSGGERKRGIDDQTHANSIVEWKTRFPSLVEAGDHCTPLELGNIIYTGAEDG